MSYNGLLWACLWTVCEVYVVRLSIHSCTYPELKGRIHKHETCRCCVFMYIIDQCLLEKYISFCSENVVDFDATMCHAIRIEDEHLIITAMRGIGKWQQFYTWYSTRLTKCRGALSDFMFISVWKFYIMFKGHNNDIIIYKTYMICWQLLGLNSLYLYYILFIHFNITIYRNP